tara:strand:+ start:261 stop:1709 length:1449 start_codon:yes stop_codon:yes gene_type:complete
MTKSTINTILIGASFLLTVSSNVLAQQNDNPNVLMIIVDDLNDWVGYSKGHPDVQTPHIDKLAARGIAFTNAHCQFPVCGPSRASIFSGFRPDTTWILNNDVKSSDIEVLKKSREIGSELLHCYFNRHGYKTMAVGKLQHRHIAKNSTEMSGGRPAAKKAPQRLSFNSKYTGTDWGIFDLKDEDTADHKSAQWAVERLKEQHNKPFMLMVGFIRPHVPWTVPKQWWELYDRDKIALAPYQKDDLDDLPAASIDTNLLGFMPQVEKLKKSGQLRDATHSYLAAVSFVDHKIGMVLEALDNSPYKDNTIVILFSDHGYHIGEKGSFQKHSLWQRATCVPMIISTPRMTVGKQCHKPVELLDVYPTMLDLCGLPPNLKNEGISLVPLLEDLDLEWDKYAITTYRKQKKHCISTAVTYVKEASHSVFGERYHYILYHDGSEELYDLEKDPNEWQNIASDEEMQPVKERLKKAVVATANAAPHFDIR